MFLFSGIYQTIA